MKPTHLPAWSLVLVCALPAAGGCGDDDEPPGDDGAGAGVCGDGSLNGNEQCDGTALGLNDCTTVGDFAGGTLACGGGCAFDTRACLADAVCGNAAVELGEECDGAELGGLSCAAIDGFSGGTLACSDACELDTGDCFAASTLIADARAAPDGAASLPIAGATVTYVKPALGQDPAGFFVQEGRSGPALFVAVDPAALQPVPAAGHRVSFTITEMGTSAGQRRVLAMSDLSVDGSGADLAALVQDVSAEGALVSALADFDSELVWLAGTIAGPFEPAGSPAVAADVSTAAIAGGAGLRFRLDGALQDQLDLSAGCAVRIGPTPLWRFEDLAQPSAWALSEVAIASCNPPRVVGAAAIDDTTVVVSFDRRIAPLSVGAEDFRFNGGLAAVGATASGRDVTVTTAPQTPAAAYLVTVAGLTDLRGAPVDAAADTAMFGGFGGGEAICDDGGDDDVDGAIDCFDPDCTASAACQFAAQPYIWEFDPNMQPNPDGSEFIEIWNNTGAAVDLAAEGWYLMLLSGSDDLSYDVIQLGPGTLPADGVWVVGSAAVAAADQVAFTTDGLQNGVDGILLVRCDDCAGAADFSGDGVGFDPGTAASFASDSGAIATKLDAVAYDNGGADDTGLWSRLIDVTAQVDEDELGDAVGDSVQRTSLAGWLPFAPTAGAFE